MNKLWYNISMAKSEFNKIYNSLVPREDICSGKVPKDKKFEKFYSAVYLRDNCKFLYEYFSNLYGDDYGEKIIKYLVDNTFTLTNPSQFTNSKTIHVENGLWITDEIPLDLNKVTVMNILGDILFHINRWCRHERHVVLPDVLVLLATLYRRFVYTKNLNNKFARFPRLAYKIAYVKSMLSTFLKALSTSKEDFENLITLSIVDKNTFNLIIEHGSASRNGGYLNVKSIGYKEYLEFIKLFLQVYRTYQRSNVVNVCKIAYFIHPTESLTHIINKKVAEYLGVKSLFVGVGTKGLYFSNDVDFNNDKYSECIDKIIKYTKTNKSREEIIKVIQETIKDNIDFVRDRIDYEQMSLYKYMKKLNLKVDKPFVLYNSREYENLFSDKRSEVVVDYEKVHDDLLSFEEELDKIAQVYVDAQAINQARLSIFKGINYTDCRCNVKIKNVSKNLIPFVYNRLVEENNFLRNSFGVNFTFEVENKIN